MNDEGALHRRPRPHLSRRFEGSTERGRPTPRLVIEIELEGRADLYIRAHSREDELRMRDWLSRALARRASLSTEIVRWLDELDERDRMVAW